jgi:hypothetical protein
MPVVTVFRSIRERLIAKLHFGQTWTLSQCFLPSGFEDSEFKSSFPCIKTAPAAALASVPLI